MKTLERLTVFKKDQCLGHESNLTMICMTEAGMEEWGKGRNKATSRKRTETKEKGIDLTACNTSGFSNY